MDKLTLKDAALKLAELNDRYLDDNLALVGKVTEIEPLIQARLMFATVVELFACACDLAIKENEKSLDQALKDAVEIVKKNVLIKWDSRAMTAADLEA